MKQTDHISQDEGLLGNEKIEEAIVALQQELSAEMLAHTLTVVRRRMREQDGKLWWAAFTSFEEELKGGGSVMSTFLTGIHPLFESALKTDGIEGVIINPWNRTLMLDKNLIQIVLGQPKGDS